MTARNLSKAKRKSVSKHQNTTSKKSLQVIDNSSLSNVLSDNSSTTARRIFRETRSHIENQDVLPPQSGPVHEAFCFTTSGRQVRSSSEPAALPTSSEVESRIFAPHKVQSLLIHPEKTNESTIVTQRHDVCGHNNETFQQVSVGDLSPGSPDTSNYGQAFCGSIGVSFIRCRTVSREMEELYQDRDTMLILSSIMQRQVKHLEDTAEFKDGDTLVTKIVKGMNAIMKPPTDLTDHFDLSKINILKNNLKKEQAGLESLQTISLWNETFRYDYAMKIAQARVRSNLVKNPSSVINFCEAEVQAVRELVDVVSKGRSEENYRKHERFWKFLSDLRIEATANEKEDDGTTLMFKEGIIHILLFRTGMFNRRFFNKTKSALQTVRKWNQIYCPYMKEVRARVLATSHSEFAYETDLHQSVVRKALKTAQINWVSGAKGLDPDEQQLYLTELHCMLALEGLSTQSTKDVLLYGIKGESERNKSTFICLVPYEGPPNGKRRADGSPASRVLVAPCPVVPISRGDFLGVMSGQLRYSPDVGRPNKAIQGPYPKFWLDFSKITGRLSCMKASASSDEPNVTLIWKRHNSECGADWRIEVVAIKEIWPFEELVRRA